MLVCGCLLFVGMGTLAAGCRKAASASELCSGLAQLRLTRVYVTPGAEVTCPAAKTLPLSRELSMALEGQDPIAVAKLLRADKGSALAVVVGGAHKGVLDALSRMATPDDLRAVAIGPRLAVYAPSEPSTLTLQERDALAYVARALLRGAREPSLNSFPPALRKVERVEVMVLLRERGEARLWRSAKGTSLARALLTATRVARDRWRERESAMGGPLPRRLLDLDVEVSQLVEDGTLLSNDQSFVDRAVTGEYGLGFEYMSAWHYVLPADMEKRGKGSAYRALTWLLGEQGLGVPTLAQSAMRTYRLTNRTLGVSRAPLTDDQAPPK